METKTFVDMLIEVGACHSRGEARRFIRGGGLRYNYKGVVENIVDEDAECGVYPGFTITLHVGRKRVYLWEYDKHHNRTRHTWVNDTGEDIDLSDEEFVVTARVTEDGNAKLEAVKRRKDLKFQTVSPEWQVSVEEDLVRLASRVEEIEALLDTITIKDGNLRVKGNVIINAVEDE